MDALHAYMFLLPFLMALQLFISCVQVSFPISVKFYFVEYFWSKTIRVDRLQKLGRDHSSLMSTVSQNNHKTFLSTACLSADPQFAVEWKIAFYPKKKKQSDDFWNVYCHQHFNFQQNHNKKKHKRSASEMLIFLNLFFETLKNKVKLVKLS